MTQAITRREMRFRTMDVAHLTNDIFSSLVKINKIHLVLANHIVDEPKIIMYSTMITIYE
jgi:hypothetical protein